MNIQSAIRALKRTKRSAAGFLFLIALAYALSLVSPAFGRFASLIFPERITPEEIREQYKNGALRVLIVPGHSNDDPGASYRGIRESDLNVMLATRLTEILNEDERISAYIVRNRDGEYASWFMEYLANNADAIRAFRRDTQKTFDEYTKQNGIVFESRVRHNFASNKAGLALHGVNKFANERDLDIVLHIHFNDHPGRTRASSGKYSGFSIYVPDGRFPNSRSSAVLANSLRARLMRFVPISNHPGEASGIVEDSELIAIGSNASRDGASLLIEYGYIYEDQIASNETREPYLKELAMQTYLGLREYLDDAGVPHKTTILPHRWDTVSMLGARGSLNILALQYALLAEGLYPPRGKTVADCPLNGNYGPCTTSAISAFQERYALEILAPYGLSRGTGRAGLATISKLNELYGE